MYQKHTIGEQEEIKISQVCFIPLIPIGVSILGALAGKVIGDVYDLVKKKVTGSGMNMKHKTIKDKHNFLLEFLGN